MRAGTVLRVLAVRHSISLLVVRLYAPYDAPVPAEIARLCCQMTLLPVDATASRTSTVIPHLLRVLFRGAPPPTDLVAQAGSAFQDVPFDVVHVFRLAMLPFARPYVGASGRRLRRHLDLDDVESITRRRLAELYRSNGDDVLACFEEAAAARAEALEAEVLRDFDRIYVCSEVDKQALAARSNTPVCVLPNALPVSAPLPRPGRTGGPFTFLFVGTLGYYPNEEGIVHFCAEVLPLLRRTAPRDFQVIIVGSGATPAVQQLAGRPEVRLVGAVPDVAPWYAEADAVVVPIRAGGGTRIKVLEAFSYRRPVVSTSIGIEGIGAHDGKHVLVGDTPAAFSEQCMRLMTDPSLSERLTDRAFSLFMRAYTTDAVARSLAACAEPRPRPG